MGRITYKNARDLERMREAGRLVSTVLAAMRDAVRPGVSTLELDELARELIQSHGAWPSFLNYRVGRRVFRHSICASVNEEVVHGIPRSDRVLAAGDLVKLDVGVKLSGFHADSAITVPVGEVSPERLRLLEVTREALWAGIRAIRCRGRLQDISGAIQAYVEKAGFSVVREMVGHGVGRSLHEPPQVPNYTDKGHPNPLLLEGMTLAIEPMVNLGGAGIAVLPDQWTVVTADGTTSAHFEHTVAVTRQGPDVLTLGPHDSGNW